jgi:hypothetical protein
MNRPHSTVLFVLLVGAALLVAGPLWADDLSLSEAEDEYEFNQTRTCLPTGPNACQPGEEPLPVRWGQGQVEYRINSQGSQSMEPGSTEVTDELKHAVFESFDAWNDLECSDFEMVYGGTTEVEQTGYDPDTQTVNVVMWQDGDWPHPLYDAVALTTVTYRPCNGEILSADIELNTADYTYTNHEGSAGTQIDLRNTMTHEAGHFLGLDHSPNAAATMYATAPPGEIEKRDLHEADIAGLCFIYPAGEDYELPACGTEDRGGRGRTRFCSATPGEPSPVFVLMALTLVGLVIDRRRRRT